MKKYLFLLIVPCISLVGCKKEDSDDPNTSNSSVYDGKLVFEKELDISGLSCPVYSDHDVNDDYLFVQDTCNRIIRFNAAFEAVDWIGYNSGGFFGINDLSEQGNDTKGLISLMAVTNDKLYFANWINGLDWDTIFTYSFSSGNVEKIGFSKEITAGPWVANKDGEFIYYEYSDKFYIFNADGTLKTTFGEGLWCDKLFVDEMKNIYAIVYNDLEILKFDESGGSIKTIDVELSASFANSTAMSGNSIYWQGILRNSRSNIVAEIVNIYNLEGEKLKSFKVDGGSANYSINLSYIFNGRHMEYNLDESRYEIWKFVDN